MPSSTFWWNPGIHPTSQTSNPELDLTIEQPFLMFQLSTIQPLRKQVCVAPAWGKKEKKTAEWHGWLAWLVGSLKTAAALMYSAASKTGRIHQGPPPYATPSHSETWLATLPHQVRQPRQRWVVHVASSCWPSLLHGRAAPLAPRKKPESQWWNTGVELVITASCFAELARFGGMLPSLSPTSCCFAML